MLDGMDADGEWSDEDGVKSGSATALSDNEPDDRYTTRKTLPTIPGTPTNQKIDPVHAILDKIDAELGAIAAANNITTFSQPVSVKKSSFPSFERTKLEAQGVVFDDNDRARTGHTRGGSSDRDTGVGTGSVHDDGGSEHKRIMGTAQIHSDVADLTDVQTDDGRKLDEGHSDLDSVAAQQIDEKFKEIMRKKRGGYLDDLRARIPRPESDRATVKSEEGVAPRLTDPPHRSRRSRSSGPQGKPPRPSPPRSCLTPPSSPRRGPADLPSYQRQTFLSPPVPKQSQNTSQLYTGYASDIDSVKTEDFESRFQDLIIGPHLKDSSSKLKPVSNKLSKADSNSQVQSEMNNTKLAYSKPPRSKPEPKSFLSSRIISNFQDKPTNNSSLRMSSLSPSRPSTGSTSTGTNNLLSRPRSVSPARLRQWSDSHRSRNSGLFSWDDDFWRTSSPRRSGSASTFEEVESLCLSKSSSSIESHQPRGYTRPVLSRSFTRESSITSNSTGTGASSGHDSSGGRSQSISSIGSALEDGESFELPNQLSDSTYMERIFQRVLDWRTGEQSNGAWKCENWNNPQVRPGSAGALGTGGQKKGRKKVLIIPDEEEEGIPFAKMKFNHKPDFKSEQDLKSIGKRKLLQRQSSQSDESLSSRQMKKLLPSQVSICSQSTDLSSWHDSSCNQTSRSESFEKARQSPVCSRAISVDNLSSFPPAPPQEFYAPYNPYLPVHAERMLMNLGFGGADSLLPERFLKDWYQKMQKAQQESQQLSKSPDGQETTDENINFSHDPSARSTPNTGYMFPEAMIPFPSQRFLQRSATVSSYHPDTEVSARKEQRTQEVSYTPRMSGSHLNGHSEFGSTRKRRQWANSRQQSLPLFLETLNEEDESRSKTSTSDQFSKLKAFLADELMSLKSSSSSQDNSHTDSESESYSHAADNTQQETQEQETVESSKVLDKENLLVKDALNKYILSPSKDSLEVADIMQNTTKSKKQKLLEPAMVSIVLEDVDGNVICNSSDPAKEDHLTIPCSQSCLAASPIPLSPVTVIEVSLDNQQDSVDTDDGPSSSRETDSGNSTSSFQNEKSKSKLSENCSKIFSPEQASLQSYNVDNQFSSSVEADDGTLSPIIKFPPLGEVLTWLEESRDCEYYVAHDQGIQCEPVHHSENQHQDYADRHHGCQTHSMMADKEVQTSVTTVSNQTQTETDDSLEYDNTMYQRVISNYVASNDYVNLTKEGEPVSTTSTVHTISPLFVNDGSEVDCLTDDWVISNFRSQTKQQHSLPKLVSQDRLCSDDNNLTTDETEQGTRVHDETDSGEHASDSVEKANNSLVKLNEDGSPMTKLDIFATQFLAEAEDMCSHMSHFRAKDEMRRDSIISSTLSDDSLGTVILNTKLRQKPSLSEDYLQKKDSFGADVDPFQGQSSTEDDAFSVTTASPLDTSSFLMPWTCTSNTRSLALSRNPRHFDNGNESLAGEEFYRISQAKMKKGIGGYKSQSMDLISGHVPLRRTHALSLPLDSMNAGSWSMFSTSVSSDSTDAESHQSISNSSSVNGIGNQGNYRNHQLSIPTVFEQCQKQVESNVQICFQDDSDKVSHIPCDVPAQKQHLLKPSIRVSFESDETVTDEDIDDKPAPSEHISETLEGIVHHENTAVDKSHLVLTEDSAYQEIKEVSESRTLCNDEHVEGEGDKRILLKLLPNVHSQKTTEGSVEDSQRTEKQSVNSNSLGIVNQMTTIYESDSDMSDYEHYRKEKRKTNSHFEFTKSRSWNGTRKQMRLKSNLNVKSHSLNMGEKARGQFGRLARKAFIKTKAVRVQSPTSSSDQETTGKHNKISTENNLQINQHSCQTNDESSIKDISKNGEEDNEKGEKYDETTLDNEGSIKSDHKVGKLCPEKQSNGISFTLKRIFLTPSQAAEKSLSKEDVLRPDVTPYLDKSNSFKPIASDDTLSSCSESSFESNYVPTAVRQGSFLQIPSATPDHDFQDITNQKWTSEPMFLSPSSQGSSIDTTSSDVSQGTPVSSPQSLISPTSRELLTLQKDSVFRSLSPADRRQLSRPIYATPVARKSIRSPEAERILLYSEERNSKNDQGLSSKLSPVQNPIIGSRRLSSSGSSSAFKECYTSKSSSPLILQDRDSVSSSSPLVLHCDMSSENLNLVSPELGKYDKNPRLPLHKTPPPQEMNWLKSEDTEPFHSRLLDRQHTEKQLHSTTLDQRQPTEEPLHSRSLEQRQLLERNQRKQEKNGHSFSLLDNKSHVNLGNGQILTSESSVSLINANSCGENKFLLTGNTSVSEGESLSTLHPAPVVSYVNFRSTSIGKKSDLRESKDEGFFSKELLEDIEETDKQSGDRYSKGHSRTRSHNQPKLSVSAIKSKFECGTKDLRTITNVTQSKKFVHQNIRHIMSKYENC